MNYAHGFVISSNFSFAMRGRNALEWENFRSKTGRIWRVFAESATSPLIAPTL